MKAAGQDPKLADDKMIVAGLIGSIGSGATAQISFAELQRVNTYQTNCHSTGEVKRVNNIGQAEFKQACDQKTGVGHLATPAPIKLADGDAAGLKRGQIIHAAIDPKTRVGYLIKAAARTDELDVDGRGPVIKLRGLILN